MGIINVLDSKVFNRIAAGEVVDRVYSVVKELVENSLDAKASSIEIEIRDGGLSLIKISDNGIGIAKDDLKTALLPHATSKISTISDLDEVTTLGFRGEALPSIASVSKLTITSKTNSSDFGYQIYSENGECSDPIEFPITNGTEICVNNLFYNAPVRAKFLRSQKSESNDVFSTVSRFILGNPNVSFKLIEDGKCVLQSFGDGIESAFCSVYGVETLNNCFYIDTEKNGIKINGYVSKHNFTKPNRTFQTIFVNGRYVNNVTISSAISNAYSSYLMKRQYPFYFLNVVVPNSAVDVNVHPSKIEVRFLNNQVIYGAIYSVLSKVLDGTNEALNIITETDNYSKIEYRKETTNEIKSNYVTHNNTSSGANSLKIEFSDIFSDEIKNNQKNVIDVFAENKKYLDELEKKKIEQSTILQPVQQEITNVVSLTYVGQTLNTFLIFDDGINVYLVDQHAFHERIIYDKLCSDYSNKTMIKQPLIIPYILNLSAEESKFISSKLTFFSDFGFDIEEFGRNSFKVSTIPAYLNSLEVSKFFDNVLSDLNELKVLEVNFVLFEKLAQKACKSAIKSGDKVTKEDIDVITEKLNTNIGLKCPHGRPVAVKITRTEIDKWFKRIV